VNVLNQLAGRYSWNGFPYYVNLAASGYVEIYDPSDLDTWEFLEWVRAEVVPYAHAPAEDETEQEELGEGES